MATQDGAERSLDSAARLRCIGTKGGYSVENKSCSELRQKQMQMVNGSLKRVDDKILHVCQAQVRCERPLERCRATPGGATKQ